MEAASLLWILVAVLVAVGLVGVVLPVLPGAVVVWAGLALGAWIDDFAYVGPGTLVLLGALALASYGVDFAATALGAQRVGAHRQAVVGAALGALVGLFFGLPGIVLGPFVGAAVGEFAARGSLEGAGRVGFATWVGLLLGSAAKVAIVFTMLLIFGVRRFF